MGCWGIGGTQVKEPTNNNIINIVQKQDGQMQGQVIDNPQNINPHNNQKQQAYNTNRMISMHTQTNQVDSNSDMVATKKISYTITNTVNRNIKYARQQDQQKQKQRAKIVVNPEKVLSIVQSDVNVKLDEDQSKGKSHPVSSNLLCLPKQIKKTFSQTISQVEEEQIKENQQNQQNNIIKQENIKCNILNTSSAKKSSTPQQTLAQAKTIKATYSQILDEDAQIDINDDKNKFI